jgi:hypothetical protein
MLGAAIIHPEKHAGISLMPEPIVQHEARNGVSQGLCGGRHKGKPTRYLMSGHI